MSIHPIHVWKKYIVVCPSCEFNTDARSAGEAETAATEHIEEYDDLNCRYPNQDHVVSIQEITTVGRF